MISTTLLVLVALSKPAPVHAAAPNDAAAWVYAPDVSGALKAVESTPFAALLPALLPDDVRKALRKETDAALLGALLLPRGRAPQSVFLADAGKAAGPWMSYLGEWARSLGFSAGVPNTTGTTEKTSYQGRGVELFAFRKGTRIGFGPGALADDPTAAAPTPLSTSPAFLEQWARSPEALVRGHVSVPKVFGWLARRPNGQELASLLTRLGFASLERVDWSATAQGKTILSKLTAEVGGKPEGILAALGPAQPVRAVTKSPKELLGVTMLSVHPRRVLPVIGRVAKLYRAMQWTLFQSQLETVEKREGVVLSEALGDEAKVWTTARWASGHGEALVLEASVASPKGLHKLVNAYLKMVPSILSGAKVTRKKQSGVTVAQVSRGGRTLASIAFGAEGLVVSSDGDSLKRHLDWKKSVMKTSKQKAVAWGYRNDAADVPRWLRRTGLSGRLGTHRKAVEGAFGSSTWHLKRVKQGRGSSYALELRARGR